MPCLHIPISPRFYHYNISTCQHFYLFQHIHLIPHIQLFQHFTCQHFYLFQHSTYSTIPAFPHVNISIYSNIPGLFHIFNYSNIYSCQHFHLFQYTQPVPYIQLFQHFHISAIQRIQPSPHIQLFHHFCTYCNSSTRSIYFVISRYTTISPIPTFLHIQHFRIPINSTFSNISMYPANPPMITIQAYLHTEQFHLFKYFTYSTITPFQTFSQGIPLVNISCMSTNQKCSSYKCCHYTKCTCT